MTHSAFYLNFIGTHCLIFKKSGNIIVNVGSSTECKLSLKQTKLLKLNWKIIKKKCFKAYLLIQVSLKLNLIKLFFQPNLFYLVVPRNSEIKCGSKHKTCIGSVKVEAQIRKKRGTWGPIPKKKPFAIDSHWPRKKQFSTVESLNTSTTLQGRPHV